MAERFSRETVMPRLVAAGAIEPLVELESGELLARLEFHAAEAGRLEGRLEVLDEVLERERAARRRLAETLKRERAAAKALHERVERAEMELAQVRAENGQLVEARTAAEQHAQIAMAQLRHVEQQLALKTRPAWRKLLRKAPK
jgi:chromosome segregation ATPase